MKALLKALLVAGTLVAAVLTVIPTASTPRAASLRAATADAPAPATIAELIPAPLLPDRAGDTGGAIDITGVSFKQRGVELEFKLRTAAPLKLETLDGSKISVCLLISSKASTTAFANLCLGGPEDAARLDYTRLDKPSTTRRIRVSMNRPNANTIVTTIRPGSIGLVDRDFAWQLAANEAGGKCAAALSCLDLAPNDDRVSSSTQPVAAPACFGGAARPINGSCVNRALRLTVVPTPDDAELQPNAYCRPTANGALVNPCRFGVEVGKSAATVALIGDSHAAHWRGALAPLASSNRWVGFSMTRSRCRFSTTAPTQPDLADRAQCVKFRAELVDWFRAHPKVRTVFLSNHVGGIGGPGGFQRGARDTARQLDKLPSSVKDIYVIRDVPVAAVSTNDCIDKAMRLMKPAGPTCALPRKRVLSPDETVRAAKLVKRKRVHVIDLTARFCSRRMCLPVIGGALVHKDIGHITDVFATSLGPALAEQYRSMLKRKR